MLHISMNGRQLLEQLNCQDEWNVHWTDVNAKDLFVRSMTAVIRCCDNAQYAKTSREVCPRCALREEPLFVDVINIYWCQRTSDDKQR